MIMLNMMVIIKVMMMKVMADDDDDKGDDDDDDCCFYRCQSSIRKSLWRWWSFPWLLSMRESPHQQWNCATSLKIN